MPTSTHANGCASSAAEMASRTHSLSPRNSPGTHEGERGGGESRRAWKVGARKAEGKEGGGGRGRRVRGKTGGIKGWREEGRKNKKRERYKDKINRGRRSTA